MVLFILPLGVLVLSLLGGSLVAVNVSHCLCLVLGNLAESHHGGDPRGLLGCIPDTGSALGITL